MKLLFTVPILALVFIFFTGCEQSTKNISYSYPSATTHKSKNIVPSEQKNTQIQNYKNTQKENSFFDDTALKNQEIQKKIQKDENTIVVIYPSNDIGKYALDAINSINTYLIYTNSSFKAVMYDIKTQNEKNYTTMFKKLQKENKTKIIALFTEKFFQEFQEYDLLKGLNIYFPLINIQDQNIPNYSNFLKYKLTFGAISYKNQIASLILNDNATNIIDLYDNSKIGTTIHNFLPKKNLIYQKEVNDKNAYYKNFLQDKRFTNSTVFLNTPIIKSSILLSQMTAHELEVKKVLSTQLNYSPLIFSLTQRRDRKNITVANSIGHIPKKLLEVSKLTNSDIQYNWVNYASIVALEYLKSGNVDLFKDLQIKNNQVLYPVYLYKVAKHSFEQIR